MLRRLHRFMPVVYIFTRGWQLRRNTLSACHCARNSSVLCQKPRASPAKIEAAPRAVVFR